MLFAVVINFITMFCNCYCYVDRLNYQLAVFDYESYVCEVAIGVTEVFRFQFHIIRTCICSAYAVVSVEGEIIRCIKRIADFYFITCYGMFFTVIICCSTMLGNSYGYVDRLNYHLAVFDFKGYCCEVAIGVCKVFCSQFHIVGACICSAYAVVSAEGEIFFLIKVTADTCYIITIYGMFFTVISYCITVFCNRYGYINRFDGKLAVSHHEGYLTEVCIGICKLVFAKAHRIRACIDSLCYCGSAEGEVIRCVKFITDISYFIAGYTLFVSVIIHGCSLTGNGYHYFLFICDNY